jgi:hypothetical protein
LKETKKEYVDDFYDTRIDEFLAGVSNRTSYKKQHNDKGKRTSIFEVNKIEFQVDVKTWT